FGSPALREFKKLQLLQKAGVPAPRAVSAFSGFRINNMLGDAVLMNAIEPGVSLDRHFNELELAARNDPSRREIARQIVEIIRKLAKARLGHRDLHLGNFLLSQGKVYLLDAYAVRRSVIRVSELLMLGHSVRRYATKTELLRAWIDLGGDKPPPANNRIVRRFWRKELSRITGENAFFGRLRDGDWSGSYFKSRRFPFRWSTVSQLEVTAADWKDQWPRLLGQIQSQQLRTIKQSRSGRVLAGEIVLAGVPVRVIVKQPRRKYWHRYLNEIGRGSRSRRAWTKSWSLIMRDIPTAWPILMIQRRRFGYVVDQLLVFEQISGSPLARTALDDLSRDQRDLLFHRLGRLLRRLEALGLYHWDAKASNFMVTNDPVRGPAPILIDVDGIRKIRWTRSSIHRLLDSLRQAKNAYNPADSLALCRGYAPEARIEQEIK
ncbi:MAG TPA: lipopolysaccharide kinase InaA family protein, partial [Tepidisphaeraceae bacterium]|nr:lipopolysaccharide kinase InaA family protein [Tepidisphaeraceae bacterium]